MMVRSSTFADEMFSCHQSEDYNRWVLHSFPYSLHKWVQQKESKIAWVSITLSHPSRRLLLCSSSYFCAKRRSILPLLKSQPLEEPCALWWTKLLKLFRSISWWWRNSKAPACCMWCRRTFLAHFPCKRKRPRQQKKRKRQQTQLKTKQQ